MYIESVTCTAQQFGNTQHTHVELTRDHLTVLRLHRIFGRCLFDKNCVSSLAQLNSARVASFAYLCCCRTSLFGKFQPQKQCKHEKAKRQHVMYKRLPRGNMFGDQNIHFCRNVDKLFYLWVCVRDCVSQTKQSWIAWLKTKREREKEIEC